ncbi:MAG: tail fiber protein [Pseudomonadota bacterium]
MGLQWKSNAWGTLAAGIGTADTTISLSAGHGGRFPNAGGNDYFYATLINSANQLEVVKVTNKATDTLTVVRNVEGTGAHSYAAGDRIEVRIPAKALESVAFRDGIQNQEYTSALAGGTVDALTASLSPAPSALVDRLRVAIVAAGANTSAAPTLNLNGLGAKTVVKYANESLQPGDIGGAGHVLDLVYSQSLDKWVLLNPYEGGLTGEVKAIAFASVPGGWLECDGSAVSRTTYAKLFSKIGTTWGAGDGINTFNLPDFRGRAIIGAGQGAGLTSRSLGQTGGAETHALTEAEMPKHYHQMVGPNSITAPQGSVYSYGAYGGGTPDDNALAYGTWSTGGGASSGSQNTGTGNGQPHNNMMPFAVVKWIIKT